ncbi:MAG: hypothetical protein F9K37_08525 [Bacteroidales bacterium]|nr:MAG: hypothetical protein F9K37_08525 [Bacteroidales bacterium]
MDLKRFACFLCFLFISFGLFAQNTPENSLVKQEEILSSLLKSIAKETSFTVKDSLNAQFKKTFEQTLLINGSMLYPFDSLKSIGKLTSNDKKVRVFTWNLPQSAGLHQYFGFIQVRKSDGSIAVHSLIDNRKNVKDLNNERLNPGKWLAGLYYQIAEINFNSQTHYILLGFDFNNLFTSKKIIEVLSLDGNENPVFGLPVFNVDNKMMLSRIVFEFSARAVFTLRYIAEQQMIIFDHLSPAKPEYLGDFQFYGPDSSFDGFKLENGKWVYVRDLDLRNPRRERPKPVDAPVEIKEPSFIYKPSAGKTL